MFGNNQYDMIELQEMVSYQNERVGIDEIDAQNYITTDNMKKGRQGIALYSGSVEKLDKVISYRCGDVLVSNIRPYLKKIWLADKNGGCSPDVLVFRVLHDGVTIPEYIYNLLYQDEFFEYMMSGKNGMKMPRGDKKMILHYPIPNAPIELQNEFANYAKSIDKLKFSVQNSLSNGKGDKE